MLRYSPSGQQQQWPKHLQLKNSGTSMTSSSTVNPYKDATQSTQHEALQNNTPQPHKVSGQACLKLKGSLIPMTVLELSRYDHDQIESDLKAKTTQAPGFFKNLPVVIDLDKLDEHTTVSFDSLISQCLTFSIKVVGIRGGYDSHQLSAKEAGLAVLSKQKEKPVASISAETKTPAPEIQKPEIQKPEVHEQKLREAIRTEIETVEVVKTVIKNVRQQSKVVHHPVRSGQQVYAADGDLIILSSVSAGAEILADGNIHVYGALRGRALAGVKGDTSARIFCHKLEAELVSIAGQYKISEDINKTVLSKPAQVFLSNDTLSFKALEI